MELPRLETLWQKYRDKGLSVVAIEATQDRDRAVSFIDKNQLTYHLLEAEAPKQVVKDQFGIKWFPTLFVVDREGRVLFCHVGFRPGDEIGLETQILALMKS